MTTAESKEADSRPAEAQPFQADVAKLLHLMVHSVYSDKSVFLRELIANAADACERLRYEAIAAPALLGDDAKARITIKLDPDAKTLTIEDNGIGMSRDEMVEALGTIARSGTKAFMERLEANKSGESATLIGQFGVGCVRDQLAQEDVLVGIDRVHHQVQQAGNVGLERAAFGLGVGRRGHGRQSSPAVSNVSQMARKPNEFKIIT